MSAVVVRASTSAVIRTAGTSRTIPLPGTPQVGDPVGIWITTDASANTISATPTGWTMEYNTTVVNGSRHFLHKKYASGDGTSLTLTFNNAANLTYVTAVLDGSVHGDFGTVGTITTRSASSTTATALATGSTAAPNLVVFHEKSSTHASAATVSPTTTTVQYLADTNSGGASTYVGTYDDSTATADRTGTWPTASTNAAGYQVPVTLAGGSGASVTAVAATATGASPAPAVSTTGNGSVTPAACTATASAVAPAVTAGTAVGYPQSGGVTPSGANVVYATTNVSSARVAYSTSSTLASPSYSGTLTPDSDGIVTATLSGLSADTVYYYGLEANGVLLVSGRGKLRTYPTAGSQADASFIFGSCQYTDSNHAIFATIASWSTTYPCYGFFHLGDLHYRDWQTNAITSASTIKAQQKSSTQQSNVAGLLAAMPWTYLWDNHDWGGAASDGTNPAKSVLTAMYRQMVPHYAMAADSDPGDGTSGAIDQVFNLGRYSFFVMDTRSQRSPGGNTDNSSKTMLGAPQKARLKAWMSTNTAPLKILLEGIPWKNYGGSTGDRWGAYLTEFAELNTYFATNGIGALYGLAGDIHTNAADDGTNESYGHVPNAVASAFDQAGTASASGWSQGVYPASGTNTSHNFGVLDLHDTGSTIVATFTGYDSSGTSNIAMTKTFALAATVAAVRATSTSAAVAPTVAAGSTVAPIALTSSAVAPAPSLRADGAVAANTASATGLAPAPTVAASKTAQVSALAATSTASAPAPTVSAGTAASAVRATATASSASPSVAAGGSIQISVPAAAGTASGLAPSLSATATIAVPPAGSIGSTAVPSVGTGFGVNVAPAAATGAGQTRAPSVHVDVALGVLAAASTATVNLPGVTATALVAALRATATSLAPAPVVTGRDTTGYRDLTLVAYLAPERLTATIAPTRLAATLEAT